MKRNWSPEELVESWTLLPLETALLANKTGPARPGFALLFKFFHLEARFPTERRALHLCPYHASSALDWR